MTQSRALVCTNCHTSYPLHTCEWCCPCGGLFDFADRPPLDPAGIEAARPGLWRYRALLPLDPGWEAVTLGEGDTPLLPVEWEGRSIYFKLESLEPTGSFKDRGSAVLVTALRGLGIRRVVEDSSGNAGASLAAYTARAGITCEICVPDTAAGPKLAQMTVYGAEVIQIKGKREYAALAAWAAAAHGAYYASHVYNPFFLAGTETLAYELWEQLGRSAPAALVLPVGNGTLFLGLYNGFHRLQQAGLIARLPHFFAVQAAACPPIYEAFRSGSETVQPIAPAPTLACGLTIGQPVRGGQVLKAVRATAGCVVSVTEEEIRQAHGRLARQGFYVEETSAVAVAALNQLQDELSCLGSGPVVVPLTGHGLKTCRQE